MIFPNFQLLDAAGPLAAFEIAEKFAPGSYTLRVIAAAAGNIRSSSGASLHAESFLAARALDTLLVAGGDGTRTAALCLKTRRFVQNSAQAARRTGSICSGTYVLAAAGLLEGRRATTHWSRSADFKRRFPNVRLEPDRIFIRQGNLWTSAGISAGIDLSLAMIEQDLGEPLARRVAQQMVVYYRRPGGQSQFSALLDLERTEGRFSELIEHVRGTLRRRHSVADLAARACMSPRQFFRAFQTETGVTPAKAVERLRAEAARGWLAGSHSVDQVARAAGFGNAERLRRTFRRLYGVSPSSLKIKNAA